MKVLIVATNREKAPIPVAPIGACSIATVVAAAGHDVAFLDLMWVKKPVEEIKRKIKDFQPDVVGLSIRNLDNTSWMNNVWYLDDAREYVRTAREFSGGKPVLVGGPSLGVLPGPVTAYVEADWGIWGDGERSVVEFLAAIENGTNPSDVLGVVTPNVGGEGKHRVNQQFRVEELGVIPNHRMWEWLDFRNYARRSGPLQIQSRRGCAFECSYCNYPIIEGSEYRNKPPGQVADEIKFMSEAFPGTAIEFVDNTFNVPLPYTYALLDAIIERDIKAPLHTSGFNPRATTEKLMDKMTEAGFTQIMITPEVANEEMLKNLQKGFTMKHLRKAVADRRYLIDQKSPMEFLWVFLLGGPGETQATMKDTFSFIQNEIPEQDMVFIQVGLRVYPDTPLHRQAVAEGVVSEKNDLLKSFHYLSPQLEPMWIYDQLMEQIDSRPNVTTLKDVMNPFFPVYLRISGALGMKAPLTSSQGGLKWLSRFGMRSVGTS